MVAFAKAIIFYLTIPSGATTGTRIVLDGINGFLLVYDANNVLIGSIAGKQGTDSLGNTVYRGITSYDSVIQLVAVHLDNAQVVFEPIGNPNQTAAAIIGTNMLGFNSISPLLQLASPNANVNPNDVSFIELHGRSQDGTDPERIRMFGNNGDLDIQVAGTIRWAGVVPETWHAVPFVAGNWANLGAPWGNAKYTRTATGLVLFSGALQWIGGASPAPVFVGTLPAGYVPNRQIHIDVAYMPPPTSVTTLLTLEVRTNGDVYLTGYAGAIASPISLENAYYAITT